MKLLFENWRKYLLNEDKVDYQAVQRFLDSLPTSVATKGMDGPLLAKFKSLYPHPRPNHLTLPDRLLEAKVSQQTLTLYRGTGGNEYREAMTGKGPLKYLTTDLRYADHFGSYIIVYKFSGKLLGPLTMKPSIRQLFLNGFIVDSYVRTLLRRGTFWNEYPDIDGVYGQELGHPNVVTYGIKNMASLTVDIAQTKKLNKAEEDETYI
jgi:hypothetical protein